MRRALTRHSGAADIPVVATHDEKSWWELQGKPPPHEARFEAEAERLRRDRTRAWRQRFDEREQRRAKTSVPPPAHGRPLPD